MKSYNQKIALLWILLAFIFALIILFSNNTFLTFFPGIFLLLLPGYALTNYLFKSNVLDSIEKICISIGLSIVIAAIGFLIIYFIAQKVITPLVLALLFCPTIVFLLVALIRKDTDSKGRKVSSKSIALITLLILFAMIFRFVYLGYSEYQGDEAGNCLWNSIQVIEGNKETLIAYRRPPTQIILPSISFLLNDSYNEFITRFPFAISGIFVVVVIYVLGRNMFNEFVGLVAGFLAAINGYLIAFSRIIQYQSIVVLSASLSLLCLHKFLITDEEYLSRKFLIVGIVFFSFGLFTHFEGVVLLPVVIYCVVRKYGFKNILEQWKLLIISFSIALLIILIFYIPFFLHPSFKNTLDYHMETRINSKLHFHSNVLFLSGSFYNSLYYLIFLIFFAGLSFIRKMNIEFKIVLFWFLTYFVFNIVILKDPGTHVYTFYPSFCILAALGFEKLYKTRKLLAVFSVKVYKSVVVILFVIFILNCSIYIYRLFIKHNPEFLWSRKYEEVPDYGLFGFPYHRGWKAVGYLFRKQELNGTYISTEKEKITTFYLRQGPSKKPKYLLIAKNPQSWYKDVVIPNNYGLIATIFYNDKPTIDIWEYLSSQKEVTIYHSEEYERLYDELDKK